MILWRISNYATLDGSGGLRVSGRWHSKGSRIVYLSDNPALAMLETLVHLGLDLDLVPDHYQLLEVDCPDRVHVRHLDETSLSERWADQELESQAIGDEWIQLQESALLRVPSAIVPGCYNYLLNPMHAEATHLSILSATLHPYDPRLLYREC